MAEEEYEAHKYEHGDRGLATYVVKELHDPSEKKGRALVAEKRGGA